LLAAALGLVAYALTATGSLDSLIAPTAEAPAPVVSGLIDVVVTPPDAQIFSFVGRGPAAVEGLAVGAAHEFIVFDQGLRPSRAMVPATATWASTEGGPLYELAVQAQPADSSAASTDLGLPQTEPEDDAAGPSGTVRVITNPPAAKVYRFVGVGPSVRIPVASIHEGQELLVYSSGYETRRVVIGPSDWQRPPDSEEYRATLKVQLPALSVSSVAETTED